MYSMIDDLLVLGESRDPQALLYQRNMIIGATRRRLSEDFNICMRPANEAGFLILEARHHAPVAKQDLNCGLIKVFEEVQRTLNSTEVCELTPTEEKELTDSIASVGNLRQSALKSARKILISKTKVKP
jgi:hypothetical protein